jgi:hypothetical protein
MSSVEHYGREIRLSLTIVGSLTLWYKVVLFGEVASMETTLLKHPTALIPVAMSLAALGIVLGYAAIFGVARQVDEGAAAHMWQLLMAGQVPIVAFFVIKWLPAHPRQALMVVAIQLGAALVAMFPVWLFHW